MMEYPIIALKAFTLIFNVLAYVFLIRGNLRLSPWSTFMILYPFNVLIEFFYSYSTSMQTVCLIVQIISWILPIRTNIINGMSLIAVYQLCMNLIASALIGISVFFASLQQENGAWIGFSRNSMLMLIAELIGISVSYLITLRIRDDVMVLEGKIKWIVFTLTSMCYNVLMIIRSGLGNLEAYHTRPDGIMFIIDIFSMSLFLIGFFILLIYIIRKRRRENRLIEAEIERSYERYSSIEELRQEYRKARHELNNLKKLKKHPAQTANQDLLEREANQ